MEGLTAEAGRADIPGESRAELGTLVFFSTFSMTKNDFFAFFIKLTAYICTSSI